MTRGGKRWKFVWMPLANRGVRDPHGLALVALYELVSQGIISRVRKCQRDECGRWFWAKFEHQKFDSKRCQEQSYHDAPAWKKRRAAYMRQLRADHKRKDSKHGHLQTR
jgi:hypothetical protein